MCACACVPVHAHVCVCVCVCVCICAPVILRESTAMRNVCERESVCVYVRESKCDFNLVCMRNGCVCACPEVCSWKKRETEKVVCVSVKCVVMSKMCVCVSLSFSVFVCVGVCVCAHSKVSSR